MPLPARLAWGTEPPDCRSPVCPCAPARLIGLDTQSSATFERHAANQAVYQPDIRRVRNGP